MQQHIPTSNKKKVLLQYDHQRRNESTGSSRECTRVSVQGVKSLGGHFACLCRGFEFYEVKLFFLLFFKKKMEILLHF